MKCLFRAGVAGGALWGGQQCGQALLQAVPCGGSSPSHASCCAQVYHCRALWVFWHVPGCVGSFPAIKYGLLIHTKSVFICLFCLGFLRKYIFSSSEFSFVARSSCFVLFVLLYILYVCISGMGKRTFLQNKCFSLCSSDVQLALRWECSQNTTESPNVTLNNPAPAAEVILVGSVISDCLNNLNEVKKI